MVGFAEGVLDVYLKMEYLESAEFLKIDFL